ncbi:MAG: hypothetical protein ACE5R6_07555 [Candidatus Heimdallarchaeota archaeon]
MVKRRTVQGTMLAGGAALAYLLYGEDIVRKITEVTEKPPSTQTTTPMGPTTPTTTTAPLTTTTSVAPIPTIITPPRKPENMIVPYLVIVDPPGLMPEPVDPTHAEVYLWLENQGTAPSFATYAEMYSYSLESGYDLLGRKHLTLQPGQREYLFFSAEMDVNTLESPTPTWSLNVRVMDPILDPLREPFEERSRKVAWYTKLPNELQPF